MVANHILTICMRIYKFVFCVAVKIPCDHQPEDKFVVNIIAVGGSVIYRPYWKCDVCACHVMKCFYCYNKLTGM